MRAPVGKTWLASKELAFDPLPIEGDEVIGARSSHLYLLPIIKKSDRAFFQCAAYESRRMSLDDDRVRIGAVPCPMDLFGGIL